ncbi:hypothetical protein LC609_16635 [Nostoc sp. XA013]|nr:hypothetical protein [Nostoc sp. XA013]
MFIRIITAIAFTLPQQAMSNKQQAVTGLGFVFEVFCKAIALTFPQERSLLINYRSIKLKHDYS